jgi:hypothetical protein
VVTKKIINLWESLINTKDSTSNEKEKLAKTNYPAFVEITSEIYTQQKNSTYGLLNEIRSSIASKEFIKYFISNFDDLTRRILEDLSKRFQPDSEALKSVFAHVQAGILDFTQQPAVRDFIEEAKQDSFDFNGHLAKIIVNLEKKLKKNTKNAKDLNFNLYLKKIINLLQGVLNLSLLEHIGDRVLTEEIRKILTNPEKSQYHFLPTLVVTLFFSETQRRKNQDMNFSSLSLLDLIQARAKIPGTNQYYTLENALTNTSSCDFVGIYRERPTPYILNTMGYHPAAHNQSYHDAMRKRAPLFESMLKVLEAEKIKTTADDIRAKARDDVQQAFVSNDQNAIESLKKLRNKADKDAQKAQNRFTEAEKESNELLKALGNDFKLDLVEQKTAHLMIHWLSLQLQNLNLQPLQLYADQFKPHTESEQKLIEEILYNQIMPLIMNRLQHFNCMLPEHIDEVSQQAFEQTQELTDSIISHLMDYEEEDESEFESNTEQEEAMEEESMPSPILRMKSLTSSPILHSLALHNQSDKEAAKDVQADTHTEKPGYVIIASLTQ